jgi:hypothetical protein
MLKILYPFQFYLLINLQANKEINECASAATYLKINESIFVHVERAENVVAELFSVAAGEEHLVHVHELGRRQLSVRTVLLQAKQTETSVSLT